MGKSILAFCAFIAMTSCTNNPFNVDMRNLASNLSDAQKPAIQKNTVKSASKKNCLYEEVKYDQDFINQHEAFEKVYWDASTNTSYIDLTNKDQITIQQEGCEYYSIEFNWLKAKDTHDLADLPHWLAETTWLYKTLVEPYAYAEFIRLCKEENYHYNVKNGSLTLSFTNHEFSEWFIKINQTDSGETSIRTGYYYK